jgi:ABC-2 type transport system permease protein
MLFRKVWLETRSRFLISLIVVLALCSLNVFHDERQAEPWTLPPYYFYVLQEGHAVLVLVWSMAITMLMMGGILRERAMGTSNFTLALPVSRVRLMLARVGTGALQALALALIPWGSMYTIAGIWGKDFSMAQAAFHLALLIFGGTAVFAIPVLVSSIISGEYTAPMLSLGILLVVATHLGVEKLRPFSPLSFMLGTEYLDLHSNLLVGPFPWLAACGWMLISVLLISIAVWAIKRRDF